ncbi:MAG: hypothetical protein U0795_24370 [Pirellulales bacterium]
MFGRKSGKKKADKVDKKKPAPAKAEPKSRKAKVRSAAPARKLPNNIYTLMLLLAFLSMMVATVMMWIELSRYGGLGAWNK